MDSKSKPHWTGIFITQKQLEDLPVYNSTNPTGVYVGKVWKRSVRLYGDGERWVGGSMHPRNSRQVGWVICTYENEPDQVKYPKCAQNGYYTPLIVEDEKLTGKIKLFSMQYKASVEAERRGDNPVVDWGKYLQGVKQS
jgi:hypothetical protein